MTDGNGGTVRPPGSWSQSRLRLALIASLAVNLLVIGAVAGAMFSWHRLGPGRGGRGPEEFGLLSFARTLPAERRAIIRKAVQAGRDKIGPMWDDIRKARDEAAAVLIAEPFDQEKFRAAIEKITEAESKLRSAGRALFINTASELSAEERRALYEWWKKRKAHHFGFRDWRRSTDTPDKTDKGGEPPP